MAAHTEPKHEKFNDPVAEARDIMGNPANPNYNLYWKRDPETLKYVEDLYRRKYPGKEVIGDGIEVVGRNGTKE